MRVLVGFDGSAGGRDALELARVLCGMTGAEALVVTVLPYGPMPVRYALLGEEEARETEPVEVGVRHGLLRAGRVSGVPPAAEMLGGVNRGRLRRPHCDELGVRRRAALPLLDLEQT